MVVRSTGPRPELVQTYADLLSGTAGKMVFCELRTFAASELGGKPRSSDRSYYEP
jgi:hypothetical protein